MLKLHPPKASKKFIKSINYFRGIAIIIIVLGHSFDLAHWEISNSLEQFIYSLSLNGTVYFVFISGFLYNHIFFSRFNYKKFLSKKIQYVLVPYILFSLIPILHAVFLNGGGYGLPDTLRDDPFRAIIWYLCTGNIILAYWYVPMAMLLFAISPIVNRIIKSGHILAILLALIPISLIVHRPIENLNALHSLIYFFPVYLLGAWSSINHRIISEHLKDHKKQLLLAALAIILGLLQVFVWQHSGNFAKEFWSITVPDINLLQKIVLCFLFISILDRYENTEIPWLSKVAETSFSIYFIHVFVLNGVFSLFTRLNFSYQGNFFIWLFVGSATVMVSMAIAFIVKTLLQKRSRYLIGW